jgi:DNA repair exonuclease SbcCD ATPase subunit
MSTCSSSKSIDATPAPRVKPEDLPRSVFQIQPDLKKFKTRNKYKSPNSTPTTTPLRGSSSNRGIPQSKEPLKENSQPYKIDLLIEKYKQEISSQSSRMQELKKNMQQYDNSIQNLLQNKAQDNEKRKVFSELEKKNKELKEKLKTLENTKEERVKKENAHLEAYLQEKIKAKSVLIQQISAIEEENLKIEQSLARYSKSELQATNAHLKSTHASLTAELNKLQSTCITQEEYSQLQGQIRDLEEMQNKLVKENNGLREEIIKEQKIELASHESQAQQRTLCREVALIKKEISMLNCLAKSIFKGEQADLSFILGAGPISEMEGKTLTEAINDINLELNVLKQCIVCKDQDSCRAF